MKDFSKNSGEKRLNEGASETRRGKGDTEVILDDSILKSSTTTLYRPSCRAEAASRPWRFAGGILAGNFSCDEAFRDISRF